MGTYLRLPQKHRFSGWLAGLDPVDVWKRTAADLAAAASEELGFAVTPHVVRYARRCLVPKPPTEPGLAQRVGGLEADVKIIDAKLESLSDRLQLCEEASHDHEQLSQVRASPG